MLFLTEIPEEQYRLLDLTIENETKSKNLLKNINIKTITFEELKNLLITIHNIVLY